MTCQLWVTFLDSTQGWQGGAAAGGGQARFLIGYITVVFVMLDGSLQ